VAALALLWIGGLDTSIKWAVSVAIVAMWLGCTYWLRERIVHPLRTISNVLAALRETTSRSAPGRRAVRSLGAVLHELNLLADTLRNAASRRAGSTALLRGVMAELMWPSSLRQQRATGPDQSLRRTAAESIAQACSDSAPTISV
jgi:hypothetical protein